MKKLISVVWMLSISMLLSAQDLSNITNNLPEGAKSIVLSADVDLDGLYDVFIAGEKTASDFAAIYQNKGDSTFFDLGVSIPYLSDAAACFTDLNNDAYIDLLYTGLDESFNYQFYIYINQHDNTFLELSHSIPGVRYGTVKCQDMDHDGWMDIFISGYSGSGNIAKLFKNNGDESFSEVTSAFDGLRSCSATIADFDHNTYPDIIYSGLNGSLTVETYYYQNQDNMQFVKKSNSLPSAQLGGVESCDINNDGFTDVAVFGKDNDNNHITKFYKNNNGLSFTLFDELTGIREGALKTADFNNDGYIDVILTGSDAADVYTTELYTNNLGAGFILETDTLTDLGYSDVLWFDFNQDNKNDLLICGTTLSASKSLLLSSNIATSNQRPDELTGLTSQTSADTVWLSWNKGTDNETSGDGLTYDLYLQSDETNDIDFSPNASLSTGIRYTIAAGVMSVNNIQLDNLPDGKYWWSVQSIDAGYLGSSFTEADTFYISRPINLGKDTTICFGDSIAFSLQDIEGSMEWYRSTNSSIAFSTSKNVKVELTQKDTFWVEVTKPYGDIIYDTVIVDIYDLPVVNLGDDKEICYGTELNLNLGSASDTVDWFTLSNAYQDNNSHTFSHSFFANDEVYAELTDINGCKNLDTIQVSVMPLPTIDLVNDTSLCLNDILQLSLGTENDSINWYSLTGPNQILNSNTYEYEVSQDDTVKVEFFDEYGCVNYDTINIYARLLPDADAGTDKLICSGYDVAIGPESAMDDWSYSWDGSSDISDQTVVNPIVHPITDTKYYLTVTDIYGCIGNDSMLVEINPVGVLDSGVDKEICIGDSVTIGGNPTAEGSILPYTYQWNPVETLQEPNSANPVAYPQETTIYSLIVYTGGCPVDTLETTVTVNPLPDIVIMNDTLAGFQEDIILNVSGGVDYEWTPSEYLDNAFIQNPLANLEQTVYFTVKVTNEFGCSDTSGVNIMIKNEAFIPELFTPNGDGINDYFKVYGFGIKEISVKIFDETGETVFESNLLDEILNIGWNGERNGHQVKDGKYFWKIDGEFYSGEKILFNGKNTGVITILR